MELTKTETDASPATQALANTGETAAVAVAEHARAQIQSRFQMALARPRVMEKVRESLLADCRRPRFCEGALYSKPVGGSSIVGPSIRFAEAALQAMGNLYQESTVVFDDEDKRIVRVSVLDLETNATMTHDVTVAKTVERRKLKKGQPCISERVNSYGDPVYIVSATDDEIATKTNANLSKAIRNIVLRLVPGWLVDECVDEIQDTQRSEVDKDPDAKKNKIIDAFGAMGVTVDDLTEYLGKPPAKCKPSDVVELGQLWQAIGKEETTWDEALEAKHPKHAAEDVVDGFNPEEGA